MGLLDFDMNDPQTMGLLSAASGMFNASGPSLMPHSLGQVLGQGFGGYMQGAQGAQKQQMAAEQLKMLKLQEQRAQNLFDMQKQAFNDVGGPAQAAAPAMPGQLGSGMFGTVAPPSGMPAIPQQQAPSGNGDAELRKLKQYAILGVPGAKELFDIYKYQTDGVKRDPGSIIDHPGGGGREFIPDVKAGIGGYDFNTNTMTPVGGYADFQAGLEGKKTAAQEAEKARYGVTTLNLKDGPRAVSTAQLPGIFGVGGGAPAAATTQPAAASPLQAHADYLSTISDPQERQSFIKAVDNKIAFAPAAQRQALAKQWNAMAAGQGAPVQVSASTGPGLELQDDADKKLSVGRADIKVDREKDRPVALASVQSSVSNLDRLAAEARAILNDPALSRVTGTLGRFPNSPGSSASDVAARLDTLKSQIGFSVLQAMRDASKTGGALGGVSEMENKSLQNNLAALDTTQSTDAFRSNLQKVIDYVDGAKGRISSAYKDTYGLDPDMPSQPKAKSWSDFGYSNPQAAIKEAQNVMLRNPAAKAEVLRRLQSMGIQYPGVK